MRRQNKTKTKDKLHQNRMNTAEYKPSLFRAKSQKQYFDNKVSNDSAEKGSYAVMKYE